MLSGGERRRLALAALVAGSANLLVLDEPTNHLDVEAREALEEALDAYDGTVLLVSHDRALIDAVATHTASIEDRTIVLRHGDYNDYLEAVAERAAPPPALPRRPAAKPKPKAEAQAQRQSAPRTTPDAAQAAPVAAHPAADPRPRERHRQARGRAGDARGDARPIPRRRAITPA